MKYLDDTGKAGVEGCVSNTDSNVVHNNNEVVGKLEMGVIDFSEGRELGDGADSTTLPLHNTSVDSSSSSNVQAHEEYSMLQEGDDFVDFVGGNDSKDDDESEAELQIMIDDRGGTITIDVFQDTVTNNSELLPHALGKVVSLNDLDVMYQIVKLCFQPVDDAEEEEVEVYNRAGYVSVEQHAWQEDFQYGSKRTKVSCYNMMFYIILFTPLIGTIMTLTIFISS